MAAGSRTLKLSILADVADLSKGLKSATTDVDSFGTKASEFGKKAALAFAAAGVAALAFAADAVKAAAQDEAAQKTLADTILATTSATAAQVKGVEDYITKTSIAVGVADDQLRPAFARLVRSTQDVDEAQRLLNLALDLSVATGKPVETISNALGKAYDGNTTALAKLGLGLDANLIKSKDTGAIISELETKFGAFAEGAAETTAVKFERMKIAMDEAKEQIGTALLPVVQQLSDYILVTFVPNLTSFINGMTGQGSLTEATENATDGAFKFGDQVRKVFKTVVEFKDQLIVLTAILAAVFVTTKIAAGVTATIALIKSLIVAYNLLKSSAIVAGVASAFALNPLLGVGAVALAAAVLAGANALANNGNVNTSSLGASTGSIPFASGFAPTAVVSGGGGTGLNGGGTGSNGGGTGSNGGGGGIAAVVKSAAIAGGFTDSQNAARLTAMGSGGFTDSQNAARIININVSGAIDQEGTARTIVDTLNNSYYRGTGGGGNLQLT
jgi:hypothetical protein